MKYLLILILICCSCVNQSDKTQDKKAKTNTESKKLSVNTQTIQDSVFHQEIVANGFIEATYRSELRFRKGDIIEKILVKNGQVVNKGQLIAHQDISNEKNQLQQAKVAVAEAENELIDLKASYGVLDQPDSTIKPAVLKNITLKSGIRQAKANLESAKIAVRQSKIIAPFKGVIANLTTKEGNYISAADNLCILISQDQLDAVFNILEPQLPFVQIDQQVKVASFANEDDQYSAKITEINPFVDENGLIRIKAHLSNPDRSIYDGMNVKVSVQRKLDSVVKIPKTALVKRSNRDVVFTVQDSLAKWNYVDIKAENSNFYAIKKGLSIKDTIIISNNMNLAHDARVNPTLIKQED
jgi:RND family efflux transporter MFP subunit